MIKRPGSMSEFHASEGLVPDDLRRAVEVGRDVRERVQGVEELLERLSQDQLTGASR